MTGQFAFGYFAVLADVHYLQLLSGQGFADRGIGIAAGVGFAEDMGYIVAVGTDFVEDGGTAADVVVVD